MRPFQIHVDKSRARIGWECQSEPVGGSFRAVGVQVDRMRRIAGQKKQHLRPAAALSLC
jgi:hypothetical protein